jgi:hypothetical protein
VEIIGVLLGAGANLEARDALGRTPWLEAARAGRCGGRAPAAAQAGPGCRDGEGRNAVQLAAMAEDVSPLLVKRLVELGIAADATDPVGRRAVDYAAEAGRWAIVALLDPSYPLPAAVSDGLAERGEAASASGLLPDRPPLTLLREALGFGNTEGMAALARLCQPEELGGLLLDPELALEPRAVDWLLGHGADPYVRDACSDTPMFALLSRGIDAVPALQVMLQRGLSPAGRVAWRASLPPAPSTTRPPAAWNSWRWNCWSVAPIRSRLRRPVIRRCRWRCAWAGCACSRPCSRRASIAKRATATA